MPTMHLTDQEFDLIRSALRRARVENMKLYKRTADEYRRLHDRFRHIAEGEGDTGNIEGVSICRVVPREDCSLGSPIGAGATFKAGEPVWIRSVDYPGQMDQDGKPGGAAWVFWTNPDIDAGLIFKEDQIAELWISADNWPGWSPIFGRTVEPPFKVRIVGADGKPIEAKMPARPGRVLETAIRSKP